MKVSERLSFDLRTIFILLFTCIGKNILFIISNTQYILTFVVPEYHSISLNNLTKPIVRLLLSQMLFSIRLSIFNSTQCGAHRIISDTRLLFLLIKLNSCYGYNYENAWFNFILYYNRLSYFNLLLILSIISRENDRD